MLEGDNYCDQNLCTPTKKPGFYRVFTLSVSILEKTRFLGSDGKLLLYSKVCATIEERTINPTDEQAQACLRVCQMFSSYYRDIQLFRFNAQTREVYIFVSDELEVIVSSNGLWRFLDETEL